MRFLSLDTAYWAARNTLVRFPMALVSALIAAIAAIRMIENSNDEVPRLVATAVLGIPLFVASVTSAERRGIAPRHRWMLDLALAAGLALLYISSIGWSDQLTVLRFAQLLVAGHLVVAVAPYLTGSSLDGFWQFNRILLLRFLLGGFFAAALFVGLAIALGALDQLFGADIKNETYAHLFVVLSFVFHPWFFLAGVPRDYGDLERRDDYPAALKVFSQFVLMPLVVIYLVILTAYLGKVLITRTWPSGWIGYLVSCVSATGVLALLLLHPLRERADSRWVNVYGRWWFVALLPSLAMLLTAIAKRIGQYGITEPRYFLLVLALWLLGLSLYYGITASRNIKLIPITLGAVALLTSMGPWSAYSVSHWSQLGRLGGLLEEHGMGSVGAPRPAATTVPIEDRREMCAVFRYLASSRGPEAIAEAIGVAEDTVRVWGDSLRMGLEDDLASRAMRRLGLTYVARWEQPPASGGIPVWANRSEPGPIAIEGFELIEPVHLPSTGWIGTATDSLEYTRVDSSGVLVIRHDGVDLFTLDVAAAIGDAVTNDSLQSVRGVPLARAVAVEGPGSGYRVRLLLDNFNGELRNGRLVWQSGSGYLLAGGFK